MSYPRSCLFLGAALMSLICTGIGNYNSSNNNVYDLANLIQKKDILIDTVHDYLQGQEKRIATLRKHVKDYLTEHQKGIRRVAQILSGANHEKSVNDDEKIKEKAVKSDPSLMVLQNNEFPMYTRLCNGEILLSMDIQKKLKCRYVDRGIPFLKIAPFKAEEVLLDPKILLYHDVIYKEEIEFLKRLSKPELVEALVIESEEDTNLTNKTAKVRIAQTAWYADHEYEQVKLLSRRVEHMTGLTIDTAEDLQIAYYEIGGFYLPHNDYVKKEEVDSIPYFRERGIANRISTVLFYLNDVSKGGGTVFPYLNLTIWPKEGSAVFWHNLKRNGEGDFLTLHGACPVISGTKWIATKWLHEVGQEFLRPCTLLENE